MIIVSMTEENKEFADRWKKDDTKQHIRVTILGEAAEYVGKRAYDDFGLGQSSISLEISKLILIAKDCLEKEDKK